MTAPAVPDSRTRNLELAPSTTVDRPRVWSWVIFAATVTLAFFGLIVSRISLDSTAFEVEELQGEIATEESRHWELRLQLARLQEPRRIGAAAEEIGLVYPEQVVVLDVPPETALEVDSEYRWAQLKTLLSAQP